MDRTAEVLCDNARNEAVEPAPSGALQLTKTVTGQGDRSRVWEFTVTLDADLYGTYGDITYYGGIGHAYLASGQTALSFDLPAGVRYSVAETEMNTGGYVTTPVNETGTVPENSAAQVEFVNDLTIQNTGKPGNGPQTGVSEYWQLFLVLSAVSGFAGAVMIWDWFRKQKR